jgi:Ca-activated chloride channel homolog
MKKTIFLIGLLSVWGSSIMANGVLFSKAEMGAYVTLRETAVNVTIEGQVASTVAKGVFFNTRADSLTVKFAFPLPEGASATGLRYKINGDWFQATFSPVPQDTTTVINPGQDDHKLREYLGKNPLFYDIEQALLIDSTMIVELSYVELLPYKFGNVIYRFPNDYTAIQQDLLYGQNLELVLNSSRTIGQIALLSHSGATIANSGNTATVAYSAYENKANKDFVVEYQLSLNELGLFALSTFLPDSLLKDSCGGGFFSFIAEPDPTENEEVIKKVFTLIIDRSGSMSGNKMVQARDAARFIVENLNEGDKFNVISFASDITSFSSTHMDYTIQNREAAIDYIQSLNANGWTNISGSFDTAIPQFQIADNQTANIIIFFTDGEQTAGILDTDQLISHINNLIVQSEKQIALFTFGIGSSVNERLLSAIAANNNGMAEYLKDEDLESAITDFYLMIQNPVLLNTHITYSPDVMAEIYPKQLPNLYKGKQLMVVGRYTDPGQVMTQLSGNSYSNAVEYDYTIHLADTFDSNMQFLTKLWARGKIDYLTEQYYINMNELALRDSIKDEVIDLSLSYGVMSIFTSFQGSTPGDDDDYGGITTSLAYERDFPGPATPVELSNEYITVEALYPNPATSHFILRIASKAMATGALTIELVDSRGLTVHSMQEQIIADNNYRFLFDVNELNLKSGIYLVLVRFQGTVITCRIVIN